MACSISIDKLGFKMVTISAESSQRRTLKTFCDETTIHGLKEINGTEAGGWKKRLMWFMFFLLMITFTIWLSVIYVQTYLEFEIQTSNVYEYAKDGLAFPAITICSSNLFRQSLIGNSPPLLSALTLFLNQRAIRCGVSVDSLIDKTGKLCRGPPITNVASEFTDPIKYIKKYGFEGAMEKAGMTSNLSVVKCWFNDKEVPDCSSRFYHHVNHMSLCFTINGGKVKEHDFADNMGAINENKAENDDSVWTSAESGPRTSLRLLLNAHQEEYCGIFRYTFGGGFYLQIQDQAEVVGISDASEIYIQPGKSYDIAVNPLQFRRNTEHLGLCNSTIKFDNIKETYSYVRSICMGICLIKFTVAKCHCIPPVFAKKSAVEFVTKILGKNYTTCGISELPCFAITFENFLQTKETFCKHCLRPCNEISYNPFISKSILPSVTKLKQLSNSINISNKKYAKKNYVLINIYFESLNVRTVYETQQMTFRDLWLQYVGNNIGMFLGMSFWSLFVEPVFEIILRIQFVSLLSLKMCRKLLKQKPGRHKLNKIRFYPTIPKITHQLNKRQFYPSPSTSYPMRAIGGNSQKRLGKVKNLNQVSNLSVIEESRQHFPLTSPIGNSTVSCSKLIPHRKLGSHVHPSGNFNRKILSNHKHSHHQFFSKSHKPNKACTTVTVHAQKLDNLKSNSSTKTKINKPTITHQ